MSTCKILGSSQQTVCHPWVPHKQMLPDLWYGQWTRVNTHSGTDFYEHKKLPTVTTKVVLFKTAHTQTHKTPSPNRLRHVYGFVGTRWVINGLHWGLIPFGFWKFIKVYGRSLVKTGFISWWLPFVLLISRHDLQFNYLSYYPIDVFWKLRIMSV